MAVFRSTSGSFKALQVTGSDLTIISSSVYIKNLTSASQAYVLTYNDVTGQVYYTASSAAGQGGTITSISQGDGVTVTNPAGPTVTVALNTGSTHFIGGVSKLTGSLLTTSSFNTWTGSNTSQFAGTSSYVTGSIFTSANPALTSSHALTASFVRTAQTASYVTGSVFTSVNPALSASYALSSSQSTTSSYALFALNGGASTTPGGNNTQIQYNNNNAFGGVPTLTYDGTTLRVTGSFTGSLTGSLFGTASWAQSASQALTASFVRTAQTASYVTGSVFISTNPALSASYALSSSNALTASFVATASYVTGSIFTSTNPALSASYAATASFVATASYVTGSVFTNINPALTASHALTASFVRTAQTASFVTGSIFTSTNPALSASYALTASHALNGGGNAFPFNGNAVITGSLLVSGSNGGFSGITGSFTGSLTGSLFGTASWANSASNAVNSQTASFLPVGTYQITSSWAQSASNAINSQTASFLPVGTYQITSSWAQSASQALTASFSPNFANTNLTLTGTRTHTGGGFEYRFFNSGSVFDYKGGNQFIKSDSHVVGVREPKGGGNYETAFIQMTTSSLTIAVGDENNVTLGLRQLTVNTSSVIITGSLNVSGSTRVSNNLTVTGSLLVNNGGYEILTLNPNTGVYTVSDFLGTQSIDFSSRLLRNIDGASVSIDWGNNALKDNNGDTSVDWANKYLQVGGLTPLNWGSRTLADSNGDTLSLDWEQRQLVATDGTTVHLNWSDPSYMSLPSVTESEIVSVLGIDGSGRVFSTASSAIGGGGASFPYTGSAIITGSLVVTGSTTSTLGFIGTASWAQNASNAVNSQTASFLPVNTYNITASWASRATTASQFTSPAGETISSTGANGLIYSANRHFITASNTIQLGAPNGVSINQGSLTTDFLSVSQIINSPTITGNNFLYGVNTNTSFFISPTSTGSLQLGRSIFLTAPSNGGVGIYAGTNVTITSSRVNLVGLNTSLNINASNFTGNIIQASGSQILLDGTHPSGSVLFVTGSVVPTGVPVNLTNDSLNRAAVQFAKSGSGDNYLMYVYIGGRWRSASLV